MVNQSFQLQFPNQGANANFLGSMSQSMGTFDAMSQHSRKKRRRKRNKNK